MTHPNPPPIFIVGVPRSGTTLMTALLSAHPDIAISPESHFFNYWLPTFKHLPIADFWAHFNQSQRFSYFNLEAKDVLEQAKAQGDLNHFRLFDRTLACYAQKLGKPRWGEKTPMHYQHLSEIFDFYPQAYILWMVRDPRAVVSSLLQVDWASPYVHKNAMLWQQSMALFKQKWAIHPQVKLVSYETLVAHPTAVLAAVCEFIQATFVPEMIEQRSQATMPIVNRAGWAQQHLQQSLGMISGDAIAKWQHTLSPTQIALIEHLCQPDLTAYGYISRSQGLSNQSRWLWQWEKLQVRVRNRLFGRQAAPKRAP